MSVDALTLRVENARTSYFPLRISLMRFHLVSVHIEIPQQLPYRFKHLWELLMYQTPEYV